MLMGVIGRSLSGSGWRLHRCVFAIVPVSVIQTIVELIMLQQRKDF